MSRYKAHETTDTNLLVNAYKYALKHLIYVELPPKRDNLETSFKSTNMAVIIKANQASHLSKLEIKTQRKKDIDEFNQ